MSNEAEKVTNPSDKMEVVQPSEVIFAEQQTIIQSLKQELDVKKKELDTHKKKIDELQDSMRRLAADFDNYQKRTVKERQTVERVANESLIKKLLDIYESLEKAVGSLKDTPGNEFIEGIKLIHKEFSRILRSAGLEPIQCVGVPLDVFKHEVLMQKTNDNVPEDTVLEEIQKGYLLNNFVLRPAKVVVSQKSTQEHIILNQDKPVEEIGG